MFGISFFELLIVFVVLLLFVGPDKLPAAARNMGRFFAELRRGSDALKREINSAVNPGVDAMQVERELVTSKSHSESEEGSEPPVECDGEGNPVGPKSSCSSCNEEQSCMRSTSVAGDSSDG